MLAGIAFAQPNSSQINVIPKPNNDPGVLKFWAQKMPAGFGFTFEADPTMSADFRAILPPAEMDGFIYYDSVTKKLSLTGAGTCGVDCMTLTTNQTAAGIKTFTNGIIMNGTSYVPTSQFLQVGSAGGVGCVYSGGNVTCTNGSGVTRVLIDQASGSSTNSGTIRTFNATDTISSVDANGTFSAIGFKVGTFASKIPIIDAAGLVTPVSFQLATGAVNGYCMVSDAVGVASWAPCSAGGSFVTTNTNQGSLSGTKEWIDNHTHAAHIYAFANNTYDLGQAGSAWRTIYGQTANVDQLEVSDTSSSHATFWRHTVTLSGAAYTMTAGASTVELQFQTLGSTDNQWLFRGTLLPWLTPSGNDGDIGKSGPGCGQCWRNGYFSGTLNAATFTGTTFNGNAVNLTGVNPRVDIGSGNTVLNSGNLTMLDSTSINNKVLISRGGTGTGGIVATSSNSGVFENRMDSLGFLTNIGYAVGTFGSGTTVITSAGGGIFTALRMTSSPSAGYILTSDASGNGTWQAPAGGSFITTNTAQTGLSGSKSTSGTWTFTSGILVQATSSARDWQPESNNAYGLGSSSLRWGTNYLTNTYAWGGSFNVLNSAGSITRGSWVQGGIDLADAAGVIQISLNGAGTATIGGVNFTGSGGVSGISALSISGAFQAASVTVNTGLFTYNRPSLGVTVGHCLTATSIVGDAAWAACGSGSFITTNTTQTGLSGDKTTSGTWIWGASGALSTSITNAGILTILNGSGTQRVQLSQGGGGAGVSGSVTVSNSGGVTSSMNNSGISTTVAFIANGNTGINRTCAAGETIRQPVYVFGILISGTCAP